MGPGWAAPHRHRGKLRHREVRGAAAPEPHPLAPSSPMGRRTDGAVSQHSEAPMSCPLPDGDPRLEPLTVQPRAGPGQAPACPQHTLPSPCRHPAVALLSPCHCPAVTLPSPCRRPAVALLSPCCHPAVTLPRAAAGGERWHPLPSRALGTGRSPCRLPRAPRLVPVPVLVLSPSYPVPGSGPSPQCQVPAPSDRSQCPMMGPSAQCWVPVPGPGTQ